jgi:hypothetical protein
MPGFSYIAYARTLEPADRLGIRNVQGGTYALNWFDPKDGREFSEEVELSSGDQAFDLPPGWSGEAALHIRRLDRVPVISSAPDGESPAIRVHESANIAGIGNQSPVAEDSEIRVQAGTAQFVSLTVDDPDGPGPYEIEILSRPGNGRLNGRGNDLTYTPDPGFTGSDSFKWRVSDSIDSSNEATVTIEVFEPTGD